MGTGCILAAEMTFLGILLQLRDLSAVGMFLPSHRVRAGLPSFNSLAQQLAFPF